MTDRTYATVLSTLVEDGVRRISLNRPDRLNAMNRALVDDVARAFDDANADPATRAIVFTGEGRAFCAGDDRKDHRHPESEAEARDSWRRSSARPAPSSWATSPSSARSGAGPWAAASNGRSTATSRSGARTPAPSSPKSRSASSSRAASPRSCPRWSGSQKAREMLMLGDRYTAADLAAIGLAFRVVPTPRSRPRPSRSPAGSPGCPRPSLRRMKRTLALVTADTLDRALALETDATVAGFLDPERRAASQRSEPASTDCLRTSTAKCGGTRPGFAPICCVLPRAKSDADFRAIVNQVAERVAPWRSGAAAQPACSSAPHNIVMFRSISVHLSPRTDALSFPANGGSLKP
jgi:enoyl-CoA hydratase/carnithine racemase